MVAAEAVVAHGQRVKSRPSVGEQALKKPGGTKVERHVPIDGVASLGRKARSWVKVISDSLKFRDAQPNFDQTNIKVPSLAVLGITDSINPE